MEMSLRCKCIVITGGSSGIGLAIAKRLTAEGAKVVITGRNQERLNAAREEVGSGCCGSLQWDVSDVHIIEENLIRAEEMMGGLDGLVNNAGVSTEPAGRGYDPWDITPDEWDAIMDVNLRGSFFLMRDFADYLRKRNRSGNILNISSNAACMDIIGPYGVSKVGLMRLTRALAKVCGPDGIIINGIAPGATFTPMLSWANDIDEPLPKSAIGRYIRPEEIAEIAAYLMSDAGVVICGHTVVADAGDKYATL